MSERHPAGDDGPARLSLRDTLAFAGQVVLPTLAKGALVRRPRVVALAERWRVDAGAVRRLQKLRRRYGSGPLLLARPLGWQGVVVAPSHVHRILDGEAADFAPATRDKRAALAHFEPNVSLASSGPERTTRRRFHDDLLESARPVHSMADTVCAIVADEVARLSAGGGGMLTWDGFLPAWYAAVRRLVLGTEAREDHELTGMLAELRAAGNWVSFRPRRRRLRRRFRERLQAWLDRAEPGSLAARIAARPNGADAAPLDQVTQWLFAFESAGLATFRALVLLAAHPDAQARVRAEAAAGEATAAQSLTRATIMESARLWPVTPAILREATRDLPWGGQTLRRATQLTIFVPFFHRDDERLPFAHRFAPELWLEPGVANRWSLIPFSEGPGTCPAHHLVPLMGSATVAAILRRHRIALADPGRLAADRPLPATLDVFHLGLRLSALDSDEATATAAARAPAQSLGKGS